MKFTSLIGGRSLLAAAALSRRTKVTFESSGWRKKEGLMKEGQQGKARLMPADVASVFEGRRDLLLAASFPWLASPGGSFLFALICGGARARSSPRT